MKRARKIKTWGDVYNAALRRGEDHGSAAERADAWERRQVRQTDRLLDKIQDEVARLRKVVVEKDVRIQELEEKRGAEARPFFPPLVRIRKINNEEITKLYSSFKYNIRDVVDQSMPSVKEMLERAAREGLERKYSERETEIAVDILRKFCGLEYVGCVFALGPMKGDMIRLRSEATGARVRIRRDELCRLALRLHEKYGVRP